MLKYLNQLEMGLAGAVIVELYSPLAKKQDLKVSRILSTSRHFYNQVGVLFSIGVVTLAFSYPYFVDCNNLPWYYVTSLVLLLGLSGAISFFLVSSYRVLLTADQRSYVLSIIASLIGVLTLIATVVAIRQGYDIIVLPMITTVGVLITAWVLNLFSRRSYGRRFRFDMSADKSVVPQRFAVLINQFSHLTETGAPIIIASVMLGLTSVSVLAVYNMVFYSLASMTKTLPRSLQASFGELNAIGKIDRQKIAYREYEYIYTFLIGSLYATASILLIPFIKVYTQGITDADYDRPNLGVLLVAIGVFQQLKQPAATVVQAAGKYSEINRNAIQSTILGISIGLAGAWLAGLSGLLAGFVVSAAYRSAFIIYYCHRHLLMMSLRKFFVRIIWNSIFFATAWMPFIFWIHLDTPSLWNWFAWAIGVFSWVGIVFFLGNLVVDWPTAKNTLTRFYKIIQNRRNAK